MLNTFTYYPINMQDTQIITSLDTSEILDSLKTYSKQQKLREVQEQIVSKLTEYKRAKARVREIKEEIRELLTTDIKSDLQQDTDDLNDLFDFTE